MMKAVTCLAILSFVAVLGCQQTGTSGSSAGGSENTSSTSGSGTSSSTSTESSTSGSAAVTPGADHSMEGQNAATPEVAMPSGLKYQDVKVGNGDLAERGMKATVHYTGWLTDGTKFDSSLDHGQPFTFTLGAGQVIRGWDEGVSGMRVGGKRHLTIPSEMGYGSNGAPPTIPPNATLVFDVELLGVSH